MGKQMNMKSALWLMVILFTISCASHSPSITESRVGLTSTGSVSSKGLPSYQSSTNKPPKITEIDHQDSTSIPKTIQQAPRSHVQLTQVTNAPIPNSYLGAQVRWGGVISSLQNQKSSTLIKILAYPLDDNGRPQTHTAPLGSFLAQASIPFDTTTYAKDREITVTGTVATLPRQVTIEESLGLPVVKTKDIYMWGESTPQAQAMVTLPHSGRISHCHYVYEGRCYMYSRHRDRHWHSSLNARYRDPWYGYWPWRYGRRWHPWYGYGWPRSSIHFGFYSD